jgi:hypothetical protein
MADYLRAGGLILRSTSQGGFEILRVITDHKGILIASGEVHKAPVPTLHIHKLPPEERLLDMGETASVRLVLERWSDAHTSNYELRAAGTETGIEVLLSGHHRYRCFWWRADVTLVDGEVAIRGPVLAPDCDS